MTASLFNLFARLTEFLGRILGPYYEIALHDLQDPQHSLVAIANSHVSGRAIGAPLTEAALKFLQDDSLTASDCRLNYTGFTAGGKTLRSSTFLIREQGQPAGMLCINFDDSKFKAVSESVLKLCHPDAFVDSNFKFDEARVLEKAADAQAERFTPDGVAAAIARFAAEQGVPAQGLRPPGAGCSSASWIKRAFPGQGRRAGSRRSAGRLPGHHLPCPQPGAQGTLKAQSSCRLPPAPVIGFRANRRGETSSRKRLK